MKKGFLNRAAPKPAPAAGSQPAQAGPTARPSPLQPFPLEQLPTDVLARIFSRLGLRQAWRLRSVSRLVRSAVEAFEWQALDITASKPGPLSGLVGALQSGRLRLCATASVKLLLHNWMHMGGDSAADVPMPAWRKEMHASYAGFIGALRAQTGGPRELSIEFSGSLAYLDDTRVQALMESLVLKALHALRSPEGSNSTTEALRFATEELVGRELVHSLTDGWVPDAGSLRTALAPFDRLRVLELPWLAFLLPAAADAIVAACPRLESLSASFDGDQAIGRLAPLACLVRLEARCIFMQGLKLGDSLAALAAGHAGRSLRAFVVSGKGDASLQQAGLAALAAMPKLESLMISGSLSIAGSSGREGVAALSALRGLRRLELRTEGDEQLAGLADVLAGMPALSDLSLSAIYYTDAAVLERVFTLGQNSLTECLLVSGEPLAGGDSARALARCGPQLRSVHLHHPLEGIEGLAAYEALAPLSRLGSKLKIDLQVDDSSDDFSDIGHAAQQRLQQLFPHAEMYVE